MATSQGIDIRNATSVNITKHKYFAKGTAHALAGTWVRNIVITDTEGNVFTATVHSEKGANPVPLKYVMD